MLAVDRQQPAPARARRRRARARRPATRLSLLARATSAPAAKRRQRGAQPGGADDRVQDDVGAALARRSRSTPLGALEHARRRTRVRAAAAAAGSTSAIVPTPCRAGGGDEAGVRREWAAERARPRGSGCAPTISSACVPIEPVAPRTATDLIGLSVGGGGWRSLAPSAARCERQVARGARSAARQITWPAADVDHEGAALVEAGVGLGDEADARRSAAARRPRAAPPNHAGSRLARAPDRRAYTTAIAVGQPVVVHPLLDAHERVQERDERRLRRCRHGRNSRSTPGRWRAPRSTSRARPEAARRRGRACRRGRPAGCRCP